MCVNSLALMEYAKRYAQRYCFKIFRPKDLTQPLFRLTEIANLLSRVYVDAKLDLKVPIVVDVLV